MPYICTRTSTSISPAQMESLKTKLGKAIEIFPGKNETWLMLDFEDGCKMYFKGDNSEEYAYVEVKLLGTATAASYSKMTAELCSIIGDVLNISPANIYVKYEECQYWGWNGRNF